jgi:hypothetical protein
MTTERAWARPPGAYIGADDDGAQMATSADIIGVRAFDEDGNLLPAPTALNLGIGLDTTPDPGIDFTYVIPLPSPLIEFSPPLTGTPTRYNFTVLDDVVFQYLYVPGPEAGGKTLHCRCMTAFQNSLPISTSSVRVAIEVYPSGAAVVFWGNQGEQTLVAGVDEAFLMRFAANGPDNTPCEVGFDLWLT